MTAPRKPRDVISRLLAWSESDDQPPNVDATEVELANAGVDVPAFLAKVQARILEVEEAERLTWRKQAQRMLAEHRPRTSRKYDEYDHSMLIAEIAKQQAAGEAPRAFFHKLEELTDDDLRTLLEDYDALDEKADGEPK